MNKKEVIETLEALENNILDNELTKEKIKEIFTTMKLFVMLGDGN